MTLHVSGSGSVRIFLSRMNALILSTVLRASATRSSGLPWSLPSSSSTLAMAVRRPSASSGGSGLPGNSFAQSCLATYVHLALDAVRLGLGDLHAPRRRSGPASSSSSSFLANFSLPSRHSPFDFGQQLLFEPRLVLLERLDGRLARRGERLAAGRLRRRTA